MSWKYPLRLSRLVCCALLAAPALAGDYYVDAVTGSNANDGLTPATAWASITFAFGNVPLASGTGLHTIHVAPGNYSAANGETFPLEVEEPVSSNAVDIEIVSTGGSAVTTVGGKFELRSWNNGQFGIRTRLRRVEGFTITRIEVEAQSGIDLAPLLRDLVIEGPGGVGMDLLAAGATLDATVEDCAISDFSRGIMMTSFAPATCLASFDRVHVRDTGFAGIEVLTVDGIAQAVLTNGSVLNSAGWGIRVCGGGPTGIGFAQFDATSCLVANNADGGIFSQNVLGTGGPDVFVTRCTIADNAGEGVLSAGGSTDLFLDTSIVYGNLTDVTGAFGALTVDFSDIGTGSTGGSTTSISADPLFVDSAAGDYRLQDGSPCIDTGNPALPVDPDGTVADMGAFPFDQGATSSYCTGKTNSLGCVPFVSWTGFASVSAPQPFALRANDVLPSEAGLLVYGFQPGNLNFHGGKLCVKAPLQRVLPAKLAKATGAPPCSGVLTRNFNARIQGGVDPQLTTGQTAYAQWRLRDPSDPAGFGDSLTDAASFLIAP